ncbi:MAG: DUF2760 domain-containing protein [Myxococcota bacterium]|nr:DUF2760 domain-containing protein [Myxococcota bacterium]
MAQTQLGFFGRLWLALILPLRVIFNASLGTNIQGLLRGTSPAPETNETPENQSTPASVIESEPVEQPPKPEAQDNTGLQVLAILQREGRFIDFLQEDVTSFSDQEVGAAARVVHEGCKRGLKNHVVLEPVRTEQEGAPIELAEGFDAHRLRLTGNVVGKPPFKGRLAHHGWQVKELQLPTLSAEHDPRVLAPAEIEL